MWLCNLATSQAIDLAGLVSAFCGIKVFGRELCVSDTGKGSSEDEEPWVFIVDGELLGEWDVDGSWMMLDGIDPPEEVEEMKRAAIAAAKARRRAAGL